MRNVDYPHAQIGHYKTHVGAIVMCSQDSSMDDTGEYSETPICRDINAGKQDESQLMGVPSEYIYFNYYDDVKINNRIISNCLFL